jgi:rubrerythrin
MTTQRLFNLLERLEGKMAELYRLYSELFATDAEASSLFFRLSMEEKSHVNIVKYERRLTKQNPRYFEKTHMDEEALSAEGDRVERLCNSRTNPSLEDAVWIALELESGAAERHYRLSILQSRPEAAKLLKGMAKEDDQHNEALRAFAAERGFLEKK